MPETAFPASPTQQASRIRIQAIDVDLRYKREYSICLKLLINDKVHQLLEPVGADQPLHWEGIKPVDVRPYDRIELRAYETRMELRFHTTLVYHRRVRIGWVDFRAEQVNQLSNEINISDQAGLIPWSVKFTFPPPEVAQGAPHAAQKSAAAILDRNPSILESLGKAREWVDVILKIGQQMSELNQVAKITLGVCMQAWKVLEKEDKCDKLVVDLLIRMGDMLPLIDAMKDQAKVANLRNTIIDILHLIEDASYFVMEYKSDGAAVRTLRAFCSSTAQEQVDDFVERFKSLKDDFDRGMVAQVVQGMEVLLNDADRELLTKLLTPEAGYDPSAGCLDGTRTTIQSDIREWVDNCHVKSLFWLYGLAGCGKTTVAHSICQQLDSIGRLAGAFFCKRDNRHLRKPENVVSTLAANLAFAYQPYGARLVTVLREKPQLAGSALTVRFQNMIMEPMRAAMGDDTNPGQLTSVIVIDGLDECGTTDARTLLATYLLELSQIAPWLKFILTSRPNEGLAHCFQRQGQDIHYRDLFKEDRSSVTDDICLFVRYRLTRPMSQTDALNRETWLTNETIKQLAARANGLFIWAQTACSVIQNSVEPDEKIKAMLSGEPSWDASKQLGFLYTTVLNEALGEFVDGAHIIRSCIAAVVVARIPLGDMALVELLDGRVSFNALDRVIGRLSSVLYRDHTGAVRVLHQSFSDYMVGDQCPVEYRIGKEDENLAFGIACLKIMTKELRFNICELEDSRLYNWEITDLDARIRNKINAHLEYSCLYWASHLAATPIRPTSSQYQSVIQLVEGVLFGPPALHWVEALSLLGKLYASETNLLELINWIQDPAHKVAIHADELQRFVAAFYTPISQSTPHLYISAVACACEQFDTIQTLKRQFPNTAQVVRGKSLGKLSNGWLRTVPHPGGVEAVSYSLDGNLMVTGSSDGIVRVWDARTGAAALPNLFQGHSKAVLSVMFSTNGERIVSGSQDKTVMIWDTRTGTTTIGPLQGHTQSVTSVAFSSDGRQIASGSDDETVWVWDAHTGGAIFDSLKGHSGPVTSVAFSPNGQLIASGSYDQTIRIWDLRTGVVIFEPLLGHINIVTSVAFSPDGERIVSGSEDGTIKIWDVRTSTIVFNPLQEHNGGVMSVAFSPDGKHIASGSEDKTVRMWNAHTGLADPDVLAGHEHIVTSVVFSPDSQRVVSGSLDYTLRIWDLRPGAPAFKPLEGHSDPVSSVAFSQDGKRIVSGSWDETVRVWDSCTGAALLSPFQGHSGAVSAVAISPDGQRIVSGSHDKTVCIWDARTGTTVLTALEGHSNWVTSVAFSPDGQHIVSGSWDETIRLWDAQTGVAVLGPLKGHSHLVTSVAFSADGQHIASGSEDNTVRVWDARTGDAFLAPLEGHSSQVTSVAFSPNGNYIASSSRDYTVRVWSAHTGIAIVDPLQGHSNWVTCVAFSPDSHYIASGSEDKTVRLWDACTGKSVLEPLKGHSSRVTSVAFSPDGHRVVSGAWDGTVRVWDLSSASTPIHDLPLSLFCSMPSIPPADVMSYQLVTSLTHEGWILDESDNLVFWIPQEYQRQRVDNSSLSISTNSFHHPVSFDFSKFKCGTEWTSVCDMNPSLTSSVEGPSTGI